MDKKITSPYIEHVECGIGKCPGFCTLFLKVSSGTDLVYIIKQATSVKNGVVDRLLMVYISIK